jgi:ABC-type multidrug transport system ATPase subunit
MTRPKLLMMDEPSLGLSSLLVQEIFRIIKTINGEGTTMFLFEQNAKDGIEDFKLCLRAGKRKNCCGEYSGCLVGRRGREGVLPGYSIRGIDERLPEVEKEEKMKIRRLLSRHQCLKKNLKFILDEEL